MIFIHFHEFMVGQILDKRHVVKENKVEQVKREKQILESLSHPNIIHLYGTFQDNNSLCTRHHTSSPSLEASTIVLTRPHGVCACVCVCVAH
jgi:serine/threonine protein kinase